MTKNLTLTGYSVEYIDLRQPKPRVIHKEIVVMDADSIRAARMIGVDITDHIRRHFERAGFSVNSITKDGRREVSVNLRELYGEPFGQILD